jgi:hypothetical protein
MGGYLIYSLKARYDHYTGYLLPLSGVHAHKDRIPWTGREGITFLDWIKGNVTLELVKA